MKYPKSNLEYLIKERGQKKVQKVTSVPPIREVRVGKLTSFLLSFEVDILFKPIFVNKMVPNKRFGIP